MRAERPPLPYGAGRNLKLCHLQEVKNAATRRMGRHVLRCGGVEIQQNRTCHRAVYRPAQDVILCVEFHNNRHQEARRNILPALKKSGFELSQTEVFGWNADE